MSNAVVQRQAGVGLLIAGYIFSALGGLIGLAIGAHIRNARDSSPEGSKVHRYDEPSRRHGIAMMVTSLVMMAVWFAVNAAMA